MLSLVVANIAGKDVQQVRMMKDKDGKVMTDEVIIIRGWKEYFERLMNEENEKGMNTYTESKNIRCISSVLKLIF